MGADDGALIFADRYIVSHVSFNAESRRIAETGLCVKGRANMTQALFKSKGAFVLKSLSRS